MNKTEIMQETFIKFEMINANVLAGVIGLLQTAIVESGLIEDYTDEIEKLMQINDLRESISMSLRKKFRQQLSGAN